MKAVDGPSAVMLVSGAAILNSFMFHKPETGKGAALTLVLALGIAGFGIVNASMENRPVYPRWTKGFMLDRSLILYETWNPISRVTASPELPEMPVYIAGRSPKLPKGTEMDYRVLRVDGAAHTAIIKFDGKNPKGNKKLKFLEYDLTNLVHYIPGVESVGIVGVGGGRGSQQDAGHGRKERLHGRCLRG
jgi:hypothetical protein